VPPARVVFSEKTLTLRTTPFAGRYRLMRATSARLSSSPHLRFSPSFEEKIIIYVTLSLFLFKTIAYYAILSYYCICKPKPNNAMMNKISTLAVGSVGAFSALAASDISQTVPDNVADPKTLLATLISVIGAAVSQLLVSYLKKVFKLDQKKDTPKV